MALALNPPSLMPLMLAAAGDISAVPAEFVKYFIMMVLALGWAHSKYRQSQKPNGSKDEPVSIAQPLEIKHTPRYAHKDEVEHIKAIVAENTKAGDERRVEILNAITGTERRLLTEVKDLHVRLNPVAEGFKAHEATLKQINHRLTESERERRDEYVRMQQRIDDAIRTASQNNRKS